MKVLGAAAADGAVELLLEAVVVVAPNRLGVGAADDDVVAFVALLGLLGMKENAGFGAAAAGSVALCPKEKVGFGASAVDASLLSAGFPKVKVGADSSVGALGLLKAKPPEAAGAESTSLLAAPKRKLDGTEGADASFSSGFPKVKVGATASLFACKDPNVELPCDVAKLGSPSRLNTEPGVVVAVVVELVFVDAVSFNDASLSFFSIEGEGEVKVVEDKGVVVAFDVLSSCFDTPKEKPPLEELLSVLDDPIPNTIPPLAPNFEPEPAAGCSDFLSSLEAAPNLKPSDELPNLNPDEAVLSLEVVSDEELPNLAPNLNPLEEEEGADSLSAAPNLKPPGPDPEELSDVPNLKPPELEVEEPKVPPAEEPKEPKALGSTLAPGLAV